MYRWKMTDVHPHVDILTSQDVTVRVDGVGQSSGFGLKSLRNLAMAISVGLFSAILILTL